MAWPAPTGRNSAVIPIKISVSAVKTDQAVTNLCLRASDHKETTINRLRKDANKSDLGGVMQTSKIPHPRRPAR